MFHKYTSIGPNGRILVLRDSQDLSGRKAISSRTGRRKPRNPKNRVLMKKAKMRTSIIFQPSQTPKKPKNLTATSNDGRMSIAYTAPDEGGSPITSYTWQYSTDSGSTWVTIRTNTTDNPITITGLTNDTPYLFRTRAINDAGNGPWSDNVSGTPAVEEVEEEEVEEEEEEEVEEETVTTPRAPTLSEVSKTWNSATISYSEEAGNGTIEYSYIYKLVNAAWPMNWEVVNGGQFTISGLAQQTSYNIKVKAQNSAGSANATITVTTRRRAPAAPAGKAK